MSLALAVLGRVLAQDQHLQFEVGAEPRTWAPAFTIVSHTEGATFSVPMTAAQPGFFEAEADIPSHRWLDLELRVDGATAWRRLVELGDPEEVHVSLLVEQGGAVTRVAWIPWAGASATAGNTVSLVLAFGWGGLVFGAVAWLTRRPR